MQTQTNAIEFTSLPLHNGQRAEFEVSVAGIKLDTVAFEQIHGRKPGGIDFFNFSLAWPSNQAGSKQVMTGGVWSKCLREALDAAKECGAKTITVLA